MKVKVKFIKPHSMRIEGKTVNFRSKQIVEIDQQLAIDLFRAGTVLPGPQFSKPMKIEQGDGERHFE